MKYTAVELNDGSWRVEEVSEIDVTYDFFGPDAEERAVAHAASLNSRRVLTPPTVTRNRAFDSAGLGPIC